MYGYKFIILENEEIILLNNLKKNFIQFIIFLFLINLITIPFFFYNNYNYIYSFLTKKSDAQYFYNYITKNDKIKYNNLLEEKCIICHDTNLNIKLECNHLYHFKCISKWIDKKDSCPLCRRNIKLYYYFRNNFKIIKTYLNLIFFYSFTFEKMLIYFFIMICAFIINSFILIYRV